MDNNYFVTLALPPEQHKHYKQILKRIYKHPFNTCVYLVQQKGQGNRHFHMLIQTDTSCIQKFRMRFRTYMRPLALTDHNLNIKRMRIPGVMLNYLARDPTTKFIQSRGWNLEALRAESQDNPDIKNLPIIPWSQILFRLNQVGYKYPERPGKYLKLLACKYDVSNYIFNPKKLSIYLRFHLSKDASDWDDVYITDNNRLVQL